MTAVASLGNPFSLPVLVNSSSTSGRVYSVFNDAFSKLWQSGLATDYSTLLSAVPGYETVIVGYSVGGAIATIASDAIGKRFLPGSTSLHLITLGSPRVGDLNYVMDHEQTVSICWFLNFKISLRFHRASESSTNSTLFPLYLRETSTSTPLSTTDMKYGTSQGPKPEIIQFPTWPRTRLEEFRVRCPTTTMA